MSYDISYVGLPPLEAHKRAIEDIKDWLSVDAYQALSDTFRDDARVNGQPSLKEFRFYAAFAGVQGFPVRAWYDELWPFG